MDHPFLHTAYADDTTFFLENKESVEELVKTLTLFSFFSGLKPNISKCEICGMGPLKGLEMAVCGMQTVDLTRRYKDIRYLLPVENKPNESKKLL